MIVPSPWAYPRYSEPWPVQVIEVERSAPPVPRPALPFRIVSRTFEVAAVGAPVATPTTVRTFNGASIQQAQAKYQAQIKRDPYLKACIVKGRYGKTQCREEHFAERWVNGRWQRL